MAMLFGTCGLQVLPRKLQNGSGNTSRMQHVISATSLQLRPATKWAQTRQEKATWHRCVPGVDKNVIEKLQKQCDQSQTGIETLLHPSLVGILVQVLHFRYFPMK